MRLDPGIDIQERPTVYRPAEDSHLLFGAVDLSRGERFLEVGTGAGLLALHAARITDAVATDVSPNAVALARENARRNDVVINVVRTDLMAGLRGPFDVVAFNPPYLKGRAQDELEGAWAGGTTGSEVAVRFLRDLPRVLSPAGRAYLLLSRANTAARAVAESTFTVRALASKPLFFERLDVLELVKRFE